MKDKQVVVFLEVLNKTTEAVMARIDDLEKRLSRIEKMFRGVGWLEED